MKIAPRPGTTRIKRGFLFIPRCLKSRGKWEWRWLRFVRIQQRFQIGFDSGHFGWWENIGWRPGQ